jgi:guanosine-3',5'-bis(diphosphate) 3'-pyrophosphohydrolase
VEDEVALAAALLHDVIEDTTTDFDDLAREFGEEVAEVVAALTKDMRKPEGVREAEYDRQLADVYDNLSECIDAKMREKAVGKARRAVAIAGDDPRLEAAVRVVEGVISQR